MRSAPVTVPTEDRLRRDLAEIDKAIAEASARGGGAWPLARAARRRLEAIVADPDSDGGGRMLPWRRPSWASGHLFADRHSAQEAARRALVELDQIMARGGIQAFGSVSLVLVSAFGVERPEGLDWRPDEVLLLQERAAVEAELNQLYGPKPAPPAEEELPLAATA